MSDFANVQGQTIAWADDAEANAVPAGEEVDIEAVLAGIRRMVDAVDDADGGAADTRGAGTDARGTGDGDDDEGAGGGRRGDAASGATDACAAG